MHIVVDAFGGDHAPVEIIKGCVEAVREYGVEITLVGDEAQIAEVFKKHDLSLFHISTEHTEDVISMEDDPTAVLRTKKQSSMSVGMRMLREGRGDAFVSAGNTGAVAVGATSIVGRIKGIKRVALAGILPTRSGQFMLLDMGANAECRPEMLVQFALMGSAYMEGVMNVKNPKVGLLNIGTEETKGTLLQQETYRRLKEAPIHFVGNVEARDINSGVCDVVVTDGFTGNVVLKLTEGLSKTLFDMIKDSIKESSIFAKLGALMMKPALKGLAAKTDYTEHGGALFLGSARPVIKAHGSSNAKAFKNAIRQAVQCVKKEVNPKIIEGLSQMKGDEPNESEEESDV